MSRVKAGRLFHFAHRAMVSRAGLEPANLRPVEAALCLLSYRDGSGTGIRTRDLWIMSPARYLSAPSRECRPEVSIPVNPW